MRNQRFNSGRDYSDFVPAPYQSQNNPYARGGNNPNQIRKRSGATFGVIKEGDNKGKPYVSAWKKNKKGFYVLFARPYKKTRQTESSNGKRWQNLFVTITNRDTMQTVNTSGMYDVDAKRLYIKDYNQIVSRGGKGGYWGIHIPTKSMTR